MGFDDGIRYAKTGDLESAVRELREVVAADDHHHKAWNALGVTLTRLERYKEAEACFQSALRIQPGEPVYLKNQAINEKKQKGESQKNHPSSPLSNRKRNRMVIGALGVLFICMILGGGLAIFLGNSGGAGLFGTSPPTEGQPLAVATPVPESPEYSQTCTIGFEKLSDRDPESALQVFDQAIQQDPAPPRAWAGKGFALNSQGKFEEAVIAFDEALKREPGYQMAIAGREIALEALGRRAT